MSDLHVDPHHHAGPLGGHPPPIIHPGNWYGPSNSYDSFGGHSDWRGHGNDYGRRRHRSRRRSHTPSSSGSRSPSPPPRRDEAAPGTAEAPEEPRGPPRHSRGARRGGPHCRLRGGPRPPFRGEFTPPPRPHGHAHHGPPPPPFDLNAFLQTVTNNPLAQSLLQNFLPPQNQNRSGTDTAPNPNTSAATTKEDTTEAFTPPLDLFTTPTAWTIHIALPGAKKDDIGVHYSITTSTLTVGGVIYRPCNAEFLSTMTQGERSVGMFERKVVLKGDDGNGGAVDEDGITAKLEDGVLIVTVPRVEKEWEDVKKVDIE